MRHEISELVGKVFTEVNKIEDEIIFVCENGDRYKLYHDQDCCESVTIDDIVGDLLDLVGAPILKAEEINSDDFTEKYLASFTLKNEYGSEVNSDGDYKPESVTFTFFKLATIKGYVDIKFHGESNGYYSESADFAYMKFGSSKWVTYIHDADFDS